MKQTIVLAFLATAISGLSMSAQAGEMSYAFIEASAVIDAQYEVEIQGVEEDGDGMGIAFGFLMGPVAFSEWRYNRYDLDGNYDAEEASARFGLRKRMDRFMYGKLDLYASISAEYANVERSKPTRFEYVDDTGLGLQLGLRHGLNPFFEWGAEIGYNNIENNHNDATIYAQWNATHAMSFRLSYRDANYQVLGPDVDLSAFRIAARINFGRAG